MSGNTRGAHPDARDWMGLRWSAWMPLMAAHPLALAQLPSPPGIYRVRRAGARHELLWLGWAEAGVRQSVERLARQVHLPLQPYDDPGNPARALWVARRRPGVSFEVSGAPLDGPESEGRRLERELRAAYEAYLREALPEAP